MDLVNNVWQACLLELKQHYNAEQFETWVAPLQLSDWDQTQGRLKIAAPNRFKMDWAKRHLMGNILQFLRQSLSMPDLQIEFTIQSVTKQPLTASSQRPASDERYDSDLTSTDSPQLKISASSRSTHYLNPDYVFDNFVQGRANMIARGAAEQVANQLGKSYNPFFVYGGVGLGKTHLIQAIGNHALSQNRSLKICYVHAEKYVSDLVKAYQRKMFDEFKRFYHSLDLLLIDDIQFFAGKQRTQEEFFYAFEALAAARSQIVLTCDTYPKELTNIDERLVSRFGSGLAVAVEPPELEMRVAILMKKAAVLNVQLPQDVAFFMAKNVRTNVRELEGQLHKVLAYSQFCHRDIDLGLTKEALKDFLSVQNRAISVESIQKTVADYYNIKVSDMHSKKRPANIAKPRQIAMYLAKELTHKSLPEIGELFGKRDHTTVLHAVRKITHDRAHDEQLNHQLHVLEQTIKN